MAVVTDTNSGLGFESTKELAKQGATIAMAVRNMAKGETAQADILKEVPQAKLELMELDNILRAGMWEWYDDRKGIV